MERRGALLMPLAQREEIAGSLCKKKVECKERAVYLYTRGVRLMRRDCSAGMWDSRSSVTNNLPGPAAPARRVDEKACIS
jgi:hypothetical protein